MLLSYLKKEEECCCHRWGKNMNVDRHNSYLYSRCVSVYYILYHTWIDVIHHIV